MVKSMTAFGRAVIDSPDGQWSFEILTVNRKGLDISLYMPREWLRFDPDIRKWIGSALARGQVTVKILPPVGGQSPAIYTHLKESQSMWQKIALDLGYSSDVVTFDFLVQQMGVSSSEGAPVSGDVLKKGIEKALQELIAMREVEGRTLAGDIGKRLDTMTSLLNRVEKRAPEAVLKSRLKLEGKLKELGQEVEGRILQEVLIFSEKTDITEEIIRLRSHIAQFTSLLSSKESIGRKWDFLAQEMLREVNTIGSKTADTETVECVIEMKSVIEQIKEQVQNVE